MSPAIFSPAAPRPMRVAGFMSGSGSNLVKLIEHSAAGAAGYEIVAVFTDAEGSRALDIAREHGLPCVCDDILAFYRSHGLPNKKDLSLRPEFDRRVLKALEPFRADFIVLAGYMSIVTDVLLDAFAARIVNVHPADLAIEDNGRRVFTGAHAVRDAILAGRKELRASTHLVRREVDGGEILVVSSPVPVSLPPGTDLDELCGKEAREALNRITAEHQERLKREGDWVALPLTLEWIGRGRFGFTKDGVITLDGEPAPRGVRLDSRPHAGSGTP